MTSNGFEPGSTGRETHPLPTALPGLLANSVIYYIFVLVLIKSELKKYHIVGKPRPTVMLP